ncbi:hypothetical protein GQ600_16484 [Phytophthora cactorum]|nr:hypothetical protein GQ600_16484 [Phytophthora cactorum]
MSPKQAAKSLTKIEVSSFNPDTRSWVVHKPPEPLKIGRKEYNKGAKLRNALRGDDVTRARSTENSQAPLASHCCVPYRLPLELVRVALDLIESTAPYGGAIDASKDPDSSEEWKLKESASSISVALLRRNLFGVWVMRALKA